MNRIEFMTELAALLQDIPAIERQDAMKYYNDYFDDAGEENEQEVIAELESPARLAEMIKANLGMGGQRDFERSAESYGEYRETGYTDTRFERKEPPADRQGTGKQNAGGRSEREEGAGARGKKEQEPPRTSNLVKVLLIVAIIFVGGPIVIPFALAIAGVVFAMIVTIFALFVALVFVFMALAIVGLVLFCAGLATLIPEVAVGLALIGVGLLLGVIGVIGVVGSVKLCIVAIPGICRGIVCVFNRVFRRKAVA